jgi:hypothetical protein
MNGAALGTKVIFYKIFKCNIWGSQSSDNNITVFRHEGLCNWVEKVPIYQRIKLPPSSGRRKRQKVPL